MMAERSKVLQKVLVTTMSILCPVNILSAVVT